MRASLQKKHLLCVLVAAVCPYRNILLRLAALQQPANPSIRPEPAGATCSCLPGVTLLTIALPAHLAAVLCWFTLPQRLLLVSGDLSVLASIDASCGSVGLSHGITSLLWVGPALLYMTAAGQVRGDRVVKQGPAACIHLLAVAAGVLGATKGC